MIETIKIILDSLKNSPELILIGVLVLGFIFIFFTFSMKFFKFLLNEVYPKIKEDLNKDKNKLCPVDSKDDNTMFINRIDELRVIELIDEKTEKFKNYNKIFEENYENIVKSMMNEYHLKKEHEYIDRILEIHEKITDLREKLAGKMATRDDIDRLNDEIRTLSREVDSLKRA